MPAIDFSKGLDFRPFELIGVSKEDGMKFLAALSPMIDLEFQNRIKNAFTEEESKVISTEAEARGIKPEDGTFFLEEKYHEKTGRYFMEEMRLLFNEYILHSAKIISQARRDAQDFAKSGDENVKKFDELVKDKKWEEAAQIFDQVLNHKQETNRP